MGGLRVGLDVVDAAQVRGSIATFGRAYLDRVFTPHEQACAAGDELVRSRALAARFAAKEATVKVLRPGADDHVDWTSIEVRRAPAGWCEVELSGHARRMAERDGITDLAVSFSHEGDRATAVVVATSGGGTTDDR